MRSPLSALLLMCLFGCFLLLAVSMAWAGKSSPATPVFEIPRVDGITIDGHGEDWGTRGFVVHFLMDNDSHRALTSDDLSAKARLGWNDEGLLVLVDVKDDQPCESDNDQAIYTDDAVEISMASVQGGPDSIQLVVSPGIDPKHPVMRTNLADRRKTAALKDIPLSVHAVSSRTQGGYQLEALIPWSAFQIKPIVGREVALQIYINDADAGVHRNQCRWFPRAGASWFSNSLMHRVRLSEKSSPPVLASAMASLERFHSIRVDVAAATELVGKTARLRNAGIVLGAARIQRAEDGTASAVVTAPIPPPGKPYEALDIDIDGQVPVTLYPVDVDALRTNAMNNAEFRFNPFVFTETSFPGGGFVEDQLMQDIIGQYTVSATFYNAANQPVKLAETPGRYGAVVTVTGEHGATFKRYFTLYRQPETIDWDALVMTTGIELPKGLGIDPTVAREQTAMVADFSKGMLKDRLAQNEDTAILLAGLSETALGSGKATWRTDAQGRNERWWAALKKQIGELPSYKYVSYLPDGYGTDIKKRWPLLIVLHGSDQREVSDEAFAPYFNQYQTVAYSKKEYPCVFIAPHCPQGEHWSPYQLNMLLDQLLQTYRIDPDRVYLTGMSMGGFGTFGWAMESPERFAAIAPICGGADPGDASRLQNLPTWVFHGAKDEVVPFTYSQKMVDALRALKADVAFRIYPNGTHAITAETLDDPLLYQWFFAHTRKKKAMDIETILDK